MRRPAPNQRYVEAITTSPDLDTSFVLMDGAGIGVTLKKSAETAVGKLSHILKNGTGSKNACCSYRLLAPPHDVYWARNTTTT